MGKKVDLPEIIKSCEQRFDRGNAESWKHGDFTELSHRIFRTTGISVSVHTLKRVFGKLTVDEDYLPQQATLDALIKYAGYKEAGVAETTGKGAMPEDGLLGSVLIDNPASENTDRRVRHVKWSYILLPVICLLVAGYWLLSVYRKHADGHAHIKQVASEGVLPASILFELNLPATNDSLFADFGDKSSWIYLPQGSRKVSHIYLIPGVYNPMIVSRQKKWAITHVNIHSQGWVAFGYRRQRELPEHYYAFPPLKAGSDSLYHITNQQLHGVGLDTAGSLFTRLSNFSPIDYPLEDFIYEATFKNEVPHQGIYCNTVQFQVSGVQGAVRFKLVSLGCSSSVINIISEQVFSGKKMELSPFAVDLATWNTVRIMNRNRQVKFYLNGKLLFERSYQRPIGHIGGIFLEFEKNGYVKSLELKTGEGQSLSRL